MKDPKIGIAYITAYGTMIVLLKNNNIFIFFGPMFTDKYYHYDWLFSQNVKEL